MLKRIQTLFLIINLVIFMASAWVAPAMALSQAPQPKAEILVKFKAGVPANTISALVAGQAAKITDSVSGLDVLSISVPQKQRARVLNALSKNSAVEYAEPNYRVHAMYAPNDPYRVSSQWGLENTGQIIDGVAGKVDADIDAKSAWDVTRGSNTSGAVKIAVLDTGIDQDHEDLTAKISLQNNFSDSPTTDDLFGHGTHVAGIAAAITHNSKGISGGCPDCVLLNGKVLDDDGSGSYDDVASGIIWAADNGAKVINLSLAGYWPALTLENAINYAWNQGAVVVAAAGNCGCKTKAYPAAYTKVVAVAASTNRDKKATFSSFGYKWVDIAAPGQDIFSTLPNHEHQMGEDLNYGWASGTSMATPITTATTALIWSSQYGTSATAVRSRLLAKADKIFGTGIYWSAGRLNANKAVAP